MRITRRDLIGLLAVGPVLGSLAAACGPQQQAAAPAAQPKVTEPAPAAKPAAWLEERGLAR